MKGFLFILILIFIVGCKSNDVYKPENVDLFVFELCNSGSMRPALSVNDTVYIDRNFPYHDLKKGDIIAFYDPKWEINYGLLHRIHALSRDDPREWIMKGDNNHSIDKFNLTESNYQGKVIRVDLD